MLKTYHISTPQAVDDAIALAAQRYVGWFTGHPTRVVQHPYELVGGMTMGREEWREPIILTDDCVFCVRLTDESAIRRVDGFQAAIDKEVLARKWRFFEEWAAGHGYEIGAYAYDASNRRWWREFIEEQQDLPRTYTAYHGNYEERPDGWEVKAFPLCKLPLRLKRKLCIEWNHIYTTWMAADGVRYDFETSTFFMEIAPKEVPNLWEGT